MLMAVADAGAAPAQRTFQLLLEQFCRKLAYGPLVRHGFRIGTQYSCPERPRVGSCERVVMLPGKQQRAHACLLSCLGTSIRIQPVYTIQVLRKA